jgi:hypothetical protein
VLSLSLLSLFLWLSDRVLLWTGGGEESSGGGRDTVLARLDNMWEDCCSVMWVELTWYYFPEELHCGRLAAHGEKEVFESHTSDETVCMPKEPCKEPCHTQKRCADTRAPPTAGDSLDLAQGEGAGQGGV